METLTPTDISPTVSNPNAAPSVYRELGYVHIEGMFTPAEIREWQQECDRLLAADWVSPKNVRTPYRKNSGSLPERIDPVVDQSPLFAALVADVRITQLLEKIFGGPAHLFKDKIIFKLPGVEGYHPHQDQAWWQLCPPDDILSVSIQIDGADSANGCIEMLPRMHQELWSVEGEFRNLSDGEIARIEAGTTWQPIATRAGDVVIFHSLAPHRSGPNTAAHPRRSLYLSYSAARHGNLYLSQQLSQIRRELKEDRHFR